METPFVTIEGYCVLFDESFKQRVILVKDEHRVDKPAPFSCNRINCLCSNYVVEIGERIEDYNIGV
ncbi:hypothetical protein F2Q69_00036815 [Brassica cretica]|uniref:Uncharacterized protein n=1 Tax=Brassica cretica TaxID=69181 RepID=A0A8S9SR66_BRACR|nr:hypothetical protein F2Q69_00036815 [Brassica cretica]